MLRFLKWLNLSLKVPLSNGLSVSFYFLEFGNLSLNLFFVYPTEVGDFVQQDDEVATIETDKIDVTVNSPASGTIVEVFAQEEDNVSVGADFFRLELGDAPKEGSWEK